ncbi:hypothetical protein Ana3638_04520 [Anaerocolumna sedimenticola]|uniref:Uncharacterized protein n=1 Tax=Anaerocolumna sedimenticola TaxID=2696063 RepID=A0A6P1TKG6_9FIRM|nr:hypothetical protein [Anaerocolumna sedimenticola]QHQ60135.1 hypothetical protein Ana3638_04520 [Anaerocolumna sedimenticola]
MKYFTTEIKTNLENAPEQPVTLSCYIPDNSQEIDIDRLHPAVVVLPGGVINLPHTVRMKRLPLNISLRESVHLF